MQFAEYHTYRYYVPDSIAGTRANTNRGFWQCITCITDYNIEATRPW